MQHTGISGSAGGKQRRRPLFPNVRRLAGAVLLPLVFTGSQTQADEAGDMALRRVAGKINSIQPAICDYTITYSVADALMMEKHHAYISGTQSGHSSQAESLQNRLPVGLDNRLFNTLDFMPRFESLFGAGAKPPLNVDAHYVGKEIWKGRTYEVVDVTLPIQPLNGDAPTRSVVLRWYVGADDLIHRITAHLPAPDTGGALADKALIQAERAKIHTPTPRSGKSFGTGDAKSPTPASGKLPVSDSANSSVKKTDKAPDPNIGMISVEAISEGARKAVTPPARPLSNPPLPTRIHWEADNFHRVLALAPDGRLLAVSTRENSVVLYDTATGEKRLTLAGQGVPITHLAFAGDGRMVAGADERSDILLWDAAKGQLRSIVKADASIRQLALSLDGARLAVFSGAVTVDIWDTAKEAKICSLSAPNAQAVSLSPDGARLVTTGATEMALWDSASGKQRFRIPYVSGPFSVLPAAWSPDGKSYVWMRSDGSVAVCDGQTGVLVRELKGMAGVLSALAFAVDGKTLLAVDTDQRGDISTDKPGLIIWNTTDWELLEARELAGTRTNGVQNRPLFAPAGRRLLLLDSEGVQIWDLAESLPPIAASP